MERDHGVKVNTCRHVTSHKSSTPMGLFMPVQQKFALFDTMSAKYTPLPNIYPETGASGGAIRSPVKTQNFCYGYDRRLWRYLKNNNCNRC